MISISRFVIWLPLIVTVPFSLVYRYVVPRIFTTAVSWGFVTAMNVPALVYVAYNLRERRLIPLDEMPKQALVAALISVVLIATASFLLP